jgi:hypothetical protein
MNGCLVSSLSDVDLPTAEPGLLLVFVVGDLEVTVIEVHCWSEWVAGVNNTAHTCCSGPKRDIQ